MTRMRNKDKKRMKMLRKTAINAIFNFELVHPKSSIFKVDGVTRLQNESFKVPVEISFIHREWYVE